MKRYQLLAAMGDAALTQGQMLAITGFRRQCIQQSVQDLLEEGYIKTVRQKKPRIYQRTEKPAPAATPPRKRNKTCLIEDVLAVFGDTPIALTTVCEKLDCTRYTAQRHASRLVQEGRLRCVLLGRGAPSLYVRADDAPAQQGPVRIKVPRPETLFRHGSLTQHLAQHFYGERIRLVYV